MWLKSTILLHAALVKQIVRGVLRAVAASRDQLVSSDKHINFSNSDPGASSVL